MIAPKLKQIQELRKELRGAYRFKNHDAMWNITNRLLTVYGELADCLLEKQSDADADSSVSAPVHGTVNVTKNSAVDFYGIGWSWDE